MIEGWKQNQSDENLDHIIRNAVRDMHEAKQALRDAQFNVKYKEISYKMRKSELIEVYQEKLKRLGYDFKLQDNAHLPDFTK